MPGPEYWQERCAAAERALQHARACILMTPGRLAILQVLGELRAGDSLSTNEAAQLLGWPTGRALAILTGLSELGLVERTDATVPPGRGHAIRWRLGYLVQVPAEACA